MKIDPHSAPQASADLPPPAISVVVPVHNEGPNLAPLVRAIAAALAGIDHEIVYVDDGSTDDTQAILAGLAREFPQLIRVRHKRSCGQSTAIITGVRAARGGFVATLDGDGQNDPADIPALLDAAFKAEAQGPTPVLIAGHRVHRRDSDAKRLASRIANKVRASLLRDATPDTGCGLKLFRRAAFLELPLFDHVHRFLPALFIRAGGRVVSVPVRHHARTHGKSHYTNLARLKVGIVDLFGVAWLQRRWKQPEFEATVEIAQ